MSEDGPSRFEIQIMRRSAAPKWMYERKAAYLSDAVIICGDLNRAWTAGEAAHRVIEVETGKEKYRRGWVRAWSNLEPRERKPHGA